MGLIAVPGVHHRGTAAMGVGGVVRDADGHRAAVGGGRVGDGNGVAAAVRPIHTMGTAERQLGV